jgi:hypothetical protein
MSLRESAACYRLYAANCAELAQGAVEPGRKLALFDLAQAWTRLADQVDKNERNAAECAEPTGSDGSAETGSHHAI